MSTTRQVFIIPLRPLTGDRFQPTGFPDQGPSMYERPGPNGTWERALLVESAQSIANHLELAGWEQESQAPVAELSGLSWVRVRAAEGEEFLTASRVEGHRLASAFVKDSTLRIDTPRSGALQTIMQTFAAGEAEKVTSAKRSGRKGVAKKGAAEQGDETSGYGMREVLRAYLGLRDDLPLSSRRIAAAVFALDPLCLLHGVFFAESAKVWPGQPKIARAVTGSIEAHNVREVLSGGVKRDPVRHSSSEGGGSTEGYGSVPFYRTEFVAETIQATFVLDLAQLRSYGLPDPAGEILETVARWQIAKLLETGLRLRTACDLVPISSEIRDTAGVLLPSSTELATKLRELIEAGGPEGLFGEGGPLDVYWTAPASKKGSAASDEEAAA